MVIEAGYRSGTSVTARLTKEQGKKVFCIPSSLENRKGIICNQIIQAGGKLVTSVEDILAEYKNINFVKKQAILSEAVIDKEYVELYNILTYKPQHINELAKKLKSTISDISYKLMMLELDDYIVELPGKNYIRR